MLGHNRTSNAFIARSTGKADTRQIVRDVQQFRESSSSRVEEEEAEGGHHVGLPRDHRPDVQRHHGGLEEGEHRPRDGAEELVRVEVGAEADLILVQRMPRT